nr:PREDICTED: nestin [Rhinolophus sinicus]
MEGCLGEESFQMWGLNRRLEAYLARVKALEEHYELLSAELVGLRAQSGDASWRARADEELAALRALVDQRWREKHAAEVARDNLEEEVQSVAGRCQQQRLARERTAEEVARSRRAVEAEKCAQAWLSRRATELERELEELRLGRVVQGAREGRLELQQLQAERGGLQERRAALEQRLEGRWQERLQATEKFQLAVGALEQEKQGLQSQIAQILEGRQQLAHLKMSLSLEVATYRTLLEAENSRLQTPDSGSKASFSFQDPKLELHFPRTPESRRLGPLLSVLSPTPLSSPLPDTLEIPVPTFLKSRETLQARTPTLASTPIPPTHQAPFPATDGEIRAQGGPPSVFHSQAGSRQVAQAMPASILPGPEEPGGKQQEASTGQSPEDHASLAQPLGPDHPSLEAKDGEPSESRECSRFQEEGEGQIWELAEKETAMEVKVVSSLQQETPPEGDLGMKGIQDAQGLLKKETLKSLEEEIQEPLMSLEKQSHETLSSLEKDNQESLRFLEDESLETLRSLGKEKQEQLKSLEEKEMEIVNTLEKETLERLKPIGKEDTQTLQPLEKENQEFMRSLEDNLETFLYPGKENQELVRSLEENFETLTALENQNQEPLRSLEEEDQETMRPLEKENQEPLRSLGDENQEIMGPGEKEIQQPPRSLGEDQTTLRPLEKVEPEPLKSPGKDQEIFRPLEKENQELLKEESVEEVRCLETENLEPLKSAGEDLEILKSIDAQEPLWSLEEANRETAKPLEKEIQEQLESVEESQESLRALEEETRESLRSLGEEGQELPLSTNQQRWEGVVVGDQELGQEMPPGRAGVDTEDDAELDLREQGGFAAQEDCVDEGELQLTTAGGAWSAGEEHPGSPEPKEQRVPAEGSSGEGDVEGLQDPEGQRGQVGDPGLRAPWEMSEVTEPVLEGEDEAPGDGRASPEVTLGLETAVGESAAVAEQGPEQEAVGLEDPGHLGREQVTEPLLGEEGLEAQGVQGLEGPRKDLEEAAALEPELSMLPMQSGAPLESPGAGQGLEPEVPWGAETVFPAENLCHDGSDAPLPRPPGSEGTEGGAEPVLGPPTPIPKDAPGSQPPTEGNQEAIWGLEGRAGGLGKVEDEQEELGSGEFPEGLQDEGEGEGEDSREESEADGLGETLPDSTPLGLYLQSPASPQWDPAGEQRPSPQGETRKEGWGPAVLASEGQGAHLEEGEGRGDDDDDEERGQDSDLLEEFEDLGTEASLLPGDPGEVMGPLGQVSQLLLQPAAWGQDGESDGFADEEASGEEGEEEEGREPGAGQWGPSSSARGLQALSSPQRAKLLGSETVDVNVSIPWDESLRGAAACPPVTALGAESQDSTEPSGSEEESEAAPLEREDPVPGPLGTLSGTMDTPGVNGQGPSLKDELEHVNGGVVSWLEQPDAAGQGKLGAPGGDRGSPLEEEEGGALKTPWAGAPLHLGPGQFLQFTQREGDTDSWSSGED